MELTNDFTVAAPIVEAWPLLTDIERIAPCVPGFKLTASSDGEHLGTMKVKVGAVSTTYDCVIRFVELDEEHHRAVIAARGKETKGQGGVTASITSTLTPDGDDRTHASVVTNLDVTGRVAQFGRGILADVSNRLVKQFVSRLEASVLSSTAESPPPPSPSPSPSAGPPPAAADGGEEDTLNLLSVAGAPIVKRLAPIALAVLVAVIVVWAITRER